MTWLLMVGGYFVSVLVSSVILIRVRPEWMLETRSASDGSDPLVGLTEEERGDYRQMMNYQSLYPRLPKAIQELAKRRRGDAADVKYQWGGDADSCWAVALSPLYFVVGLPVSVCVRGAVNSVNNSERTRAAIEKELAAAKKEIDDLLREDK